jgi:hypothetical protein
LIMLNHDVAGVRSVDIHAHFFPQAYLDVLAEEGPRFNVEYRAADEGFYIKTEVRFQGPLPYRVVDLKKRIADMDAQGTVVQAMSLTGPMARRRGLSQTGARMERCGQRSARGVSDPAGRIADASNALPRSRHR